MHYFTPAKTLPEGTIYLTDLTHVADFADEQSSKLAPALGVNYIVEADEQTALLRAEEALKAV